MASMAAIRSSRATVRQHGAYAVEYALVFPVLFVLVYGALSLAVVMTMRMSLQHAAEEGARAALRFNVAIDGRRQAVSTVAQSQTSWMPGPRAVSSAVCLLGSECVPVATATPLTIPPTCGNEIGTACQVVVAVSYDYAAHPIFPSLPGLGFLLPNSLQGRASVLVDGNTLVPL